MVYDIMQYLKVHLRKLYMKINQIMNGFFYDEDSGIAERIQSNSGQFLSVLFA